MTSITTLLKKHFDAELLFTDTDSLAYEIKSEDIYEEFFKQKHLFDFSNFPRDSKFYDNQNEMVLGKMKHQYREISINKFVALKSKIHSMLSDDGKESHTAKGVNIATEFHEFKDTLFNKKVIKHKMKRIQSKKHKPGKHEINKTSLSCFDDKRYVLNEGVHTLAHFHKDLRKQIHTDDPKPEKIVTDNEEFKKILIKRRDSPRFSQIKITAYK